jgi:hypothetical protein
MFLIAVLVLFVVKTRNVGDLGNWPILVAVLFYWGATGRRVRSLRWAVVGTVPGAVIGFGVGVVLLRIERAREGSVGLFEALSTIMTWSLVGIAAGALLGAVIASKLRG